MKKILNISIYSLLCFCSFGQRPELIIPFGHSNAVNDVAFSPDGKTILTASLDATVKLWDTDGRETYTFKEHTDYVSNAVFAPDGRAVLSSSADGTALLWNLKGELMQTFQAAPDSEITAIAMSTDGQSILLGDIDGGIKLYRPDGNNILTVDYDTERTPITALAISPDGRSILAGSHGNTARLWDTSGKLLHTLKGHTSHVSDVAFSPDGTMILSADWGGTVHLWNKDGTPLHSFSAHESGLNTLAFSPDGQKILTGSDDGTVRLWDRGGTALQVFTGRETAVNSGAISPDGQQVLAGFEDGTTMLWHIDGRQLQTLRGHTQAVTDLVFSPDGRTLWLGTDGPNLNLLDLDGPNLKVLRGHSDFVTAVAFSVDGSRLLSGSWDGTARLWTRNGQELHSFGEELSPIHCIALSADGKLILTGHDDSFARLWDSSTGQLQRQFDGHYGAVNSVAFSPDGQAILTLSGDNTVKLWDRQGNLKQSFSGNTYQIETAAFSPDGQYILADTHRGRLRWSLRDQTLQSQELEIDDISQVLIAPGGQRMITQGADNSLQLRDLNGLIQLPFATRPIVGYSAVDYISPALAFSPDGKVVVRSNWDHTIKFWRVEDGQELGSLVLVDTVNWIFTTPSGLFDASPGAMSLLHYSIFDKHAYETIELEQLKARYYEPGLLQKILGYSNEAVRPVENFDIIALYPKIKLAQVDAATQILNIQLQERNGGIGKVSIFINGKEVEEEVIPLPRRENAKRDSSIQVDLRKYRNYLFRHPDSTNTISIRAYNEAGWLKSPAIDLEYKVAAARSRGGAGSGGNSAWIGQYDPKLYVITIGTSDYSGTKLDLQYGDQDATMMAKALQAVGTALVQTDSLEVHCLTTAQVNSTGVEGTPINWHTAGKSNIKSLFDELKAKAKAEDIVVVYLSGHGVTQGGTDQTLFYYLTKDIASEDALSDPATRQAYAISSEELTDWLKAIPALKQVLIIDACNSGQIVENLTGGTKALNSSQVRALDRMKDRTGMFVISGSAADKVSYEAGEYGQGLLTYALLEGMRGVATRRDIKSNNVDVMTLFQYARDRVPELAGTINGIQTPMLGFPNRAASFDIGILDQPDAIPIGNKKPVMIRPDFMNQITFWDDLQLEQLLETALRQETEKGKDADLIYVDVSAYPGAYAISGLYSTEGDEIVIKVKLFKDRKDPIELEVPPTNDPERLVRYIFREVQRKLLQK